MSTVDPLSAAVERLRASVDALTEGERVQSWWSTTDGGDHWWVKAGGLSVANAGLGETAQRATEHIALAASPPAVRLLADLLEAVRKFQRHVPEVLVLTAEELASHLTEGTEP